jgi:hypothetical protein
MCCIATLAIELSSASMNVASVTVTAMAHGLARGRQVSWKLRFAGAVAVAAAKGLLLVCSGVVVDRKVLCPDYWKCGHSVAPPGVGRAGRAAVPS